MASASLHSLSCSHHQAIVSVLCCAVAIPMLQTPKAQYVIVLLLFSLLLSLVLLACRIVIMGIWEVLIVIAIIQIQVFAGARSILIGIRDSNNGILWGGHSRG
jgi:hypothetical protein